MSIINFIDHIFLPMLSKLLDFYFHKIELPIFDIQQIIEYRCIHFFKNLVNFSKTNQIKILIARVGNILIAGEDLF